MTFTRTKSGLANYARFFDSDVICYIEGKVEEVGEAAINDILFYQGLISSILPKAKVKIKCVGNKESALAYAANLSKGKISNGVVIVDRDYDGILSSIIQNNSIIYTYGYSWENDLWTLHTSKQVLNDLTVGNKVADSKLDVRYNFAARRIAMLSVLDISMQIHGESLLKKNRGSCGIDLHLNRVNIIPVSEVSRLINIYRSSNANGSPIVKELQKMAVAANPGNLIQGHLWAHVVCMILSSLIKRYSQIGTISNQTIINLALTKFAAMPSKCLGENVFQYYKSEITHRLHPI